MTALARIGITMGDPSGVGPEIIVKALQEMSPEHRSATAVIGNLDFLKRADKLVASNLSYTDQFDTARGGVVPVAHVPTKDMARITDGQITTAGGEAAYQYVAKAVELALAGKIAVIVTAPLNKGAMHLAGHHFDGHTELLAPVIMMPHFGSVSTAEMRTLLQSTSSSSARMRATAVPICWPISAWVMFTVTIPSRSTLYQIVGSKRSDPDPCAAPSFGAKPNVTAAPARPTRKPRRESAL
jgi:4-hydroxythreonine-4-phosphate dehydrogenase